MLKKEKKMALTFQQALMEKIAEAPAYTLPAELEQHRHKIQLGLKVTVEEGMQQESPAADVIRARVELFTKLEAEK